MQITITLPDNVVPRIAASHEGGLEPAIYTAIKVYCSLGPTTLGQIRDLRLPGAIDPLLPDSPKALTTTAVIREAVHRLHSRLLDMTPREDAPHKLYVHRTLRRPGRPPVIELQDRDRAIIHRHNAGATYQQIGEEFTLSVARVGQIISRERRKARTLSQATQAI